MSLWSVGIRVTQPKQQPAISVTTSVLSNLFIAARDGEGEGIGPIFGDGVPAADNGTLLAEPIIASIAPSIGLV